MTMVEVVFSVALISAAATAVFTLQIAIKKLNYQANRLNNATRTAQQKIEDYRSRPFANIQSEDNLPLPAALAGESCPESGISTEVNSLAGNFKKVTVYVHYCDGSAQKRVDLTTLMTGNGLNRQ